MNKLKNLFDQKQKRVLSVFVTAGFPELDSLSDLVPKLENAGVDLLEVGIPFSDPLADGTTIQKSSERALQNGMTLELLFEQLEALKKSSSIPIVLMGYFNPIYRYGLERFLKKCVELEIAGLIIPDISFELYCLKYEQIFDEYKISFIQLASTNCSAERLNRIDEKSDGFIYLLSSTSTTGKVLGFSDTQKELFKKVAGLNLKNPMLLGFGIHNVETFNVACDHFTGAIIGSAVIRELDSGNSVTEFIEQLQGESLPAY